MSELLKEVHFVEEYCKIKKGQRTDLNQDFLYKSNLLFLTFADFCKG